MVRLAAAVDNADRTVPPSGVGATPVAGTHSDLGEGEFVVADVELADVLVELADTLIDDFDVIDFLHVLTQRCVQLLDVSAAGLLLTDAEGTLQVVAKGVLAERLQVDVDRAFELLRSHSRNHNRRLSELAQAVIEGLEQLPPATATPETAT